MTPSEFENLKIGNVLYHTVTKDVVELTSQPNVSFDRYEGALSA